MIPLNLQNFSKYDLNPESRLLVKNNQLYLETKKPNFFKRLWRHFRHQYNNDRIVTQTISLGNAFIKQNNTTSDTTDKLLKNFQVIELRISKDGSLRTQIDEIETKLLTNSSVGQEWTEALESDLDEGESLESLFDETIYDLICFPTALTAPLPFILKGTTFINAKTNDMLHETLETCGILTLKDCLKQGIGPNLEDFEAYFTKNQETLIAALLAKGIIARQ